MVKMMLTRAPDPDRRAQERGHPILREPLLAHDSSDWREAAEQKDLLLLPAHRTPTARGTRQLPSGVSAPLAL